MKKIGYYVREYYFNCKLIDKEITSKTIYREEELISDDTHTYVYDYNNISLISKRFIYFRAKFHKGNLFNKKEYYKLYHLGFDGYYFCERFFKNDFFTVKEVFKEINPTTVTLEKLERELSVIDFIEFLKDNGLNTCPLTKGGN